MLLVFYWLRPRVTVVAVLAGRELFVKKQQVLHSSS